MFVIMFFSYLNLTSCSSEQVNIDDKKFGDTISLTSKNVENNILCNPEDLNTIDDSHIIIKNSGRKAPIFMVFNVKDWSLTSEFGQLGSAKSEYIMPKIVKGYSNSIEIYDVHHNNITDVKSNKQVDFEKSNDAMIQDIYNSGSFYLYENFSKQNGGTIEKVENNKLSEFYRFPDLRERFADPFSYKGSIGINPKTCDVVYAYQYFRRFDILDKNGDVIKICKSSDSEITNLDNSTLDEDNSRIYYWGVSTTENSIFLTYIGLIPNEISEKSATYIEEYDWRGNPKHKYKLDGIFSHITYLNNSFVCVSPFLESPFVVYEIEKGK